MKPFIDPAFWSDPDVEAQTPGVKLCALWLITNSQTSLLGLCSASVGRFTFETKLPAAALDKALEGLPRAFKRFGTTIYIRNFIRHQFGSGDKLMRNNFFVALKSLFLGIKDEELRNAILIDYPEFNEALHIPSKGLTKPKERKGKEREGDKGSVRGKEPKPTKARCTQEEAEEFCQSLGLTRADGEYLFNKWESNGWINGTQAVKDWKATVRSWKAGGFFPSQKPRNGRDPAPPKRITRADREADEAWAEIERRRAAKGEKT